jgi:hypothetical protein
LGEGLGVRGFQQRNPDAILGQPHAAVTTPYLETRSLSELAHVFDEEHRRISLQRSLGTREGRRCR